MFEKYDTSSYSLSLSHMFLPKFKSAIDDIHFFCNDWSTNDIFTTTLTLALDRETADIGKKM